MNFSQQLNYCTNLEWTLMHYCDSLSNFQDLVRHCFPVHYTSHIEKYQNKKCKDMWENKDPEPLQLEETVKNNNVIISYAKNLEMQIAVMEEDKSVYIKYMKECQNYVDYSDHMAPVSLKMNPEQRRINYEHNRRIILGDLGCAFRLKYYMGIHESVQQQLAL